MESRQNPSQPISGCFCAETKAASRAEDKFFTPFAAREPHLYASGRAAARNEASRTQMAAEPEQDAQNAPAAPAPASAAPEEAAAAAPRERVRVAVRVRPLTEGAKRATACAKNKLKLKTAHDEKTFKFDVVFDEAATQDRVYAHTAQKLVERVFDGRNATIMAYGQTGAAPRPSQSCASYIRPRRFREDVHHGRALGHVIIFR